MYQFIYFGIPCWYSLLVFTIGFPIGIPNWYCQTSVWPLGVGTCSSCTTTRSARCVAAAFE